MGQQKDYSEETAAAIDEEVRRIINGRYRYVETLLTTYRPLLDEIAKRLLEKEVLEEAELRGIVAAVPVSEVTALADRATDEVTAPDGHALNGDSDRPWTVQPRQQEEPRPSSLG